MLSTIQFSSFSDFIDMGGYAFNVWAVYGLFAIFLVANLWLPLIKRKSIIRNLKRARKRQLQDQ
jgi:heme exporter protein D